MEEDHLEADLSPVQVVPDLSQDQVAADHSPDLLAADHSREVLVDHLIPAAILVQAEAVLEDLPLLDRLAARLSVLEPV